MHRQFLVSTVDSDNLVSGKEITKRLLGDKLSSDYEELPIVYHDVVCDMMHHGHMKAFKRANDIAEKHFPDLGSRH